MKAVVIDIVPQVTRLVSAVAVVNGQVCEAGTLLVRIDPRPFQLEVDEARAALALATQNVGAGSASIELSLANLAATQTALANVEAQTSRTLELVGKGVMSAAVGNNARALLAEAISAVEAAEADVERARAQLGAEGAGIQQAVAVLGAAELAL